MDVVTYSDAAEFLEATREFRAAEPYLTNVIGSVAQSIIQGRRYESCHWWLARDGHDVVGVAMRTSPHNLMVSPMPDAAAVAIADAVAVIFPDLPGMCGPLTNVPAFISALRALSSHMTMPEVVYVLKSLAVATADGAARRTTRGDTALLRVWLPAFATEAGAPMHDLDASVARMLEVGWLWESQGQPVAMCGYAGPVGEPGSAVVRVGPVYTAPDQRGRGFGAAVTSAVVAHLQTMSDHVMLYADASNPTSNGVYQRIGFVEYARTGQFAFHYA